MAEVAALESLNHAQYADEKAMEAAQSAAYTSITYQRITAFGGSILITRNALGKISRIDYTNTGAWKEMTYGGDGKLASILAQKTTGQEIDRRLKTLVRSGGVLVGITETFV